MRLSAYLLAGDPAFLAESVRSYYPHVSRIVVSYDRESTSWTGTALPVDECLTILKGLDTGAKCVLLPGDHHDTARHPLENETEQRQAALTLASDGADWVLQFDTDEVMASGPAFLGALGRAEARGARALDFPSRWLYTRVGAAGPQAGRYLEIAGRLWGPAAGYPGPLAVHAGTHLTLCRQASGTPHYRVDFRAHNTDPWHDRDAIVDEVIGIDQGVLHFSWVRSQEVLLRKFGWSGHAEERSPRQFRQWRARTRHPLPAVALTPFQRRESRYRLAVVPESAGLRDEIRAQAAHDRLAARRPA